MILWKKQNFDEKKTSKKMSTKLNEKKNKTERKNKFSFASNKDVALTFLLSFIYCARVLFSIIPLMLN